MGDAQHIAVRPLPGISPEQAQAARIAALRFALECLHRPNGQEGGCGTAPDDAKEIKNVRATHNYTK